MADDWYNGSTSGNYDNFQSCGAHNWVCEGVGPTSNNWNQCSGCVQNVYGPQLYDSSDGQNSQTKYSKILLHPNGQYTLQYSCVGSLC